MTKNKNKKKIYSVTFEAHGFVEIEVEAYSKREAERLAWKEVDDNGEVPQWDINTVDPGIEDGEEEGGEE